MKNFIFCVTIGALYTYSLCLGILTATTVSFAPLALFAYCALFSLFFFGFFYNRYTFMIGAVTLLIFAILVYIALIRSEASWAHELQNFVSQLIWFTQGRAPFEPDFAMPIILSLTGIMAFFTMLNLKGTYRALLLILAGLAVFTVPILNNHKKSPEAMVLFVFCALVLLAKQMNLYTVRKEKKKKRQNPGISLALIPLCLLITVIAYALPKPEHVDNEAIVEDVIHMAGRIGGNFSLYNILNIESPATNAYDFADFTGRLGGAHTPGDAFVMTVFADEPLYLTANIKDDYTGFSWSGSTDESTELPMQGGAYLTMSHQLVPYPQKLVSIDMGGNRTRSIYLPPFSIGLANVPESAELKKSTLGHVFSETLLPEGATYSQSYLPFPYTSSDMADVLRHVSANTNYPEYAYMDNYLSLPETVPDRVIELAHKLTDDYDNYYDKIKALELYLQAFPYTYTPSSVPFGRDFVDHFLFDGQTGYCVYYASALAVMGRAVGIPTRYAEGYITPPMRNENGSYTVTTAQAHAWPEVYFPDVGWVLFEPTASFFESHYDVSAPPETPPEIPNTPDTPDTPEVPDEPEITEPENPPSPSPGEKPAPGATLLSLLMLALLITAFLLFAFFFFRASRYRRQTSLLRALPNREAALAYFGRLIKTARARGYKIAQDETAISFALRADGALPREKGPSFVALAHIFSKAAYSTHTISDEERALLKRSYETSAAALRGEMRAPRYWYYRYVLMWF